MSNKTALLFGATGLVGSHLLKHLIKDERYDYVRIFVRKPLSILNGKVQQHVIDFGHLENGKQLITGDDLFCCLGTTIRKAGNQEAFRAIDYGLTVKLAEIVSTNLVGGFYVISSIGVDSKSRNFYLRTKGEMERDVRNFKFDRLAILRPSFLLGKRNEFRLGESVAKVLAPVFNPFLLGTLKKYRSIKANTVARAILHIANNTYYQVIFESNEIQEIADKV